MNELKLKVILIQRLWLNTHYRMPAFPSFVSSIFGVETSLEVCKYAVMNEYPAIASDVSRELPIAIELDNLRISYEDI